MCWGKVKAARFSNGDVLTGLAVFSAVSPAAGEKGPSRLGLESRSRASWESTACFCCCSFHVWPAWALSSLSSPQTARSFSLISSIYRTEHSTVTYAHVRPETGHRRKRTDTTSTRDRERNTHAQHSPWKHVQWWATPLNIQRFDWFDCTDWHYWMNFTLLLNGTNSTLNWLQLINDTIFF